MPYNKPPSPPRWAERLLEWLAAEHLQEEVEGDLQELFDKRLQTHGVWKARLYYILDVLKLIHPRLWKAKPSTYSSLNATDMLQHYLLISYRTFRRFKSSFLINLIGLSTGLACTLLIYLWVNHELSMDKFHENDARLYQVLYNGVAPGKIDTNDGPPGPLAKALAEELPEVEYSVAVAPPDAVYSGVVSAGSVAIKAIPYYVTKDFFHAFTFPLVQPNNSKAIPDKNGVYLSANLAQKLYGTTENVTGKLVEWKHNTYGGYYVVTGIFETIPSNSTLQFDLVFNYEVFLEKRPDLNTWGSGQPRVYVVLKNGTDINQFNAKLKHFHHPKMGRPTQSTLFAQQFSDRYLNGRYENGVPAGGRISYVRLFSLIAFFILAIACINFVNLSTAKASTRIKEVGVKKAIGARRTDLIFQFMGESLLMSSLALLLAIAIVWLLLPEFNGITGKKLSLQPDAKLLLTVPGIALFTGVISGMYPALYLSGFRAAMVLKGKLSTASFGELLARKGLVIFQFTVSILLIFSVVVVYQQMAYVQTKNLGYNRENVIYISREGKLEENYKSFLMELKNIPGVVNASYIRGDVAGGINSRSGVRWEGQRPEKEDAEFKYLAVGFDLFETLGIEVKEGRTFSPEFPSDSTSAIIFNEAAIELMGLKDPIGKIVEFDGTRQIVGVVKNFHYQSLHEKVNPIFFKIHYTWKGGNFFVRLKAGSEKATLERLRKLYAAYNPGFPFEFKFMDEAYQALYLAEQRVADLSLYFATIAILISCLGLFGLATFTAQRRRKEIGIRKVLGSSEWNIVRLLSGEFTKMVATSIGIALPLSYLFASRWLDNFAYSITLEWWYFALAGVLALLVSWFTVGTQAIKAARINPIQILRDE